MFVVTIEKRDNFDIVSAFKQAIKKRNGEDWKYGGYIKVFHNSLPRDDGYTEFISKGHDGFVFALDEGGSVHCEVWKGLPGSDIRKCYKEEAEILNDFIGCLARHFFNCFKSLKIEFHPELQWSKWTRGLTTGTLIESFSGFDPPEYLPFFESSKQPGIFCQSYPYRFIQNGIWYETVEHWNAAKKAELFGDSATLDKIIASKTAAEARRLSKAIKNVDDVTWDATMRRIAVEGNLHKFGCMHKLGAQLIRTGDKVLVYANSRDLIWGAGVNHKDKSISAPKKWKGDNLLGFVLMEVRTILRERP